MNKKARVPLSVFTVITIGIIMTVISSNINWGKDHWKQIILTDGKGYYAYLPAIFIYKDLNLGFFEKIEKQDYYDKYNYYDYRSFANGKVIDKYFCGTAIAELPFFFIAHSLSSVLDLKTDGYSKAYQVLINIAALFYLLLGLAYLNATMSGYKVRDWVKSLVLVAAVFGTNLFYYTIKEPGMSHVYSFAFISMFFYYSRKFFAAPKPGYLLLLPLILGIIFLIRPVNGLILFILPFAAGNYEQFRSGLATALRKWGFSIAGIMIFSGVASLQFIVYKISAGRFFIDSYTGEHFDFLHPHLADILFSYKKGLFLYTPMYLVSLSGGYFLWKTSRFSFFSWFGFFLLITYVFSSWWNWYYGGSFSSRVYVEYIPLFMVLLAITLENILNRKIRIAFISAVILIILICQVQTFQYRYMHIHWSDMTKEKYWDVFLRIDKLIKQP